MQPGSGLEISYTAIVMILKSYVHNLKNVRHVIAINNLDYWLSRVTSTTQQLSWSSLTQKKSCWGAHCYQGARSWSGQGSRRYQRWGQISFIIFTISKYRIGDYRIYPGHVFKSLETILMILVIRKSLLQGLFRKYYGVECKHPSVYSKDIVEIVWQTETDRLIQGYLRCLSVCLILRDMATWSHLCTDQWGGLGHHRRFGSFLDLFWPLLSFYIIHLLSTADKIAATN